jgi:endoglucanase
MAIGDLVATLSVAGEPGAVFSFTSNPGGYFAISGANVIEAINAPAGTYTIGIQATDPGLVVIGNFTLQHTVAPPVVGEFFIGINLTGPQNAAPVFPSAACINYYATKLAGPNNPKIVFRTTLGWSQVQPFPPNATVGIQPTAFGALDPGYLASLAQYITNVAAAGCKCILDIHTFGVGPGGFLVGTPQLPISAFVDLHNRLATWLIANPSLLAAVDGIDLMNEWVNGFSSITAISAMNLAITAGRAAGYTGKYYCEGVNYTGSWNWVSGQGQPYNNSLLYTLVDPLNNIVIEPHMYPNSDNSGDTFGYAANVATPGEAPPGTNVGPNIGVIRMTNEFLPWQQQHGLPAMIGEYGSSNDSPWDGGTFDFADWNVITRNVLTYCQSEKTGITVWEGGPGQPTGYNAPGYAYSLDPFSLTSPGVADFTAAGVQHPAMVVLQEFTGYTGSQPTAYALFPPGIQNPSLFITEGTPSQSLGVYYGGKITTPQTITLHDFLADGVTPAGGTFNPPSFNIPDGENFFGEATYTASQVATILIATTNTAGWSDPPPIGVSSAPNLFVRALNISNIFALRRLYGPYLGPVIQLQRQQDNQQASFVLDNNGDLPRQAIQDWANSRVIPIVTWYDQGPLQGNAILAGTAPNLTLVNAAGYPEVTATSGTAQMSTVSQSSGKGLQTILSRFNPNNNNTYISQDIFLDMFRMTTANYDVGPDTGTRYFAATGGTNGSWQNIAGSYSYLYTTNNLNGYLNGSLHSANSAPAFTWLPTDSSGLTTLFYFRFGGSNWAGSTQDIIITYDELSAADINAFYVSDNTYYTTALPDSLTATAPTIVGGGLPNNTTFAGIGGSPLIGVSILDTNPGTPTDSLTITLTGATATLTGSGITGSNPYSVASNTPANLTTIIQALILNTAASAGSVIDIAISATSSAGPTASTTMVVTVQAYVAETPFAAPVGTFTPVNMFGVNLSGGENTGLGTVGLPQASEISYFASKGFGLIRMPITSQSAYTSAFGLLNTAYVDAMYTSIVAAFDANMSIIIDVHNYGGQWNPTANAFQAILPGTTAQLMFNDLWLRLMTKFKNCPNVIFGLMNEPNGQQSVSQWWTSVASCVTFARNGSGATQLLTIPGGATFTAASSWVSSGNGAAALSWATSSGDPANNFVFEMHQYLDSGDSGSTPVAVVGSGSTILVAATSWLATNGFKAFLGEFGVSWDPWYPLNTGANILNYDPAHGITLTTNSITENGDMLAYMKTNRAQWFAWTAWAGGINFSAPPQSGGYGFNPEPARPYPTPIVDQPQIAVLQAGL